MLENGHNSSRGIRSLLIKIIPVERVAIDINPTERSEYYTQLEREVALGILKDTYAYSLARQYCDRLPKRWVIRKFW